MDAPTESTERELQIEPATADHLLALLAGPERFHDQFGITVVDGYLEFDGALEHWLRQLVDHGAAPEWSTHLIVHRADRALIGLGGFKGPPSDGAVEIGYGIAPAYRGAGYATAAAGVLVDRARAAGVLLVFAHTLAEPNPSTGVLGHLGFTRTATVDDPDEGTTWRWELPLRE